MQKDYYWERNESSSAMKHNKSPEFIFGQLDHLTSFRPNASVLANEAYLMYVYNKTSKWLKSLDDDEKDILLDDSRKEGRAVRKKFREGIDIKVKRLEAQRLKQIELARIEKG